MDDLAAHQVDHRQDLEIGHRSPVLRVLVVEWITGGGGEAQPLPAGLAAEGLLMADRLLADLAAVPGCEVRATRDARLPPAAPPALTIRLDLACGLLAALPGVLAPDELLWPIAPETGGALEALASLGRDAGVRLMASEPATIRLAASKLATSRHLAAAGLRVVPTVARGEVLPPSAAGWVLKPDDGAGCLLTRRVADAAGLAAAWTQQRTAVAQPWIAGPPLSLSLLCARGRARLLACNRQLVREAADGSLHFEGVIVGGAEQHRAGLEPLAAAVAAALPGLFGHIGVDLVLTAQGPVLLEVNPRLTTAYAGLGPALGINPAALALDLLGGEWPSRDCPLPTRSLTLRPETAHA
jgi:predicted ATP-grasp superfamily ATP-dependent carboligase